MIDQLMIQKRASNISLAEQSGYSVRTVSNARRGLSVKPTTISILVETLNTRTFSRDSRGAKGTYSKKQGGGRDE
jgi:hypothetical protein